MIANLRSALKMLAKKIEPKVYEYGFLKTDYVKTRHRVSCILFDSVVHFGESWRSFRRYEKSRTEGCDFVD